MPLRRFLPGFQRWLNRRRAWLCLLPMLLACDTNPHDATQVPQITVTPVLAIATVTISWSPEGAQLVRVYRGTTAGDGYTASLVWSIAATGKNTLTSPVEFGVTVTPGGTNDFRSLGLVPGQAYTVQVTRADPKGTGDGFTNTSNRYVNTRTFSVPTSFPNP